MDYKVGTADGQSEGLQVLGLGEPWPIYLEGMEECYLLEPLVIRKLRNNIFAKEPTKVKLYQGRSSFNTGERGFKLKSKTGRWRMRKFRESEVGKNK